MASTKRQQGTGIPVALVYTRVSSDDQEEEGQSLAAQLSACQHYVSGQGYILGDAFTDTQTGSNDARPGYQALLNEARRLAKLKRNVAIVFTLVKRLGRNVAHQSAALAELQTLGADCHAVWQGGKLAPFVAHILMAVAEEDNRERGENIRHEWEHMRSKGWHMVGGMLGFGYRLRPATPDERAEGAPVSVLTPDGDAAAIVPQLFERAEAGASAREVGRWLASLPAELRRGRPFYAPHMARLLRRAVYISRDDAPLVGTPHSPEDVLALPVQQWEPLVSDALWLAVQHRLDRAQRVPAQAGGHYLCTGLTRCDCGRRMIGEGGTVATRARITPRYVCSAKQDPAAPNCWQSALQPALDAAAIAEVAHVVTTLATSSPTMRAALERTWQAMQPDQDEAKRWRQQVQLQERKRDTASGHLQAAAMKWNEGRLDDAGYQLARTGYEGQIRAAEGALVELQRQAPKSAAATPLDAILGQARDWYATLQQAEPTAVRDLLVSLVDEVRPTRVGRGRYGALLRWTTLGQQVYWLANMLAPSDPAQPCPSRFSADGKGMLEAREDIWDDPLLNLERDPEARLDVATLQRLASAILAAAMAQR